MTILVLLQSTLKPASRQAEKIFNLFTQFNIAAVAMLLLVIFLVIYISIKFRQRKFDDTAPEQTSGNNTLEILMIGVPALLLGYFFIQTVTVEKAIAVPVESSMMPDVIITGHQWWWEVEYPSTGVHTANEVHLPAGKHLLLEMRSADVIHDWWVPELGNKMDLVPKMANHLWLDIKEPGTYLGACSEFCGAQHAWMRIKVIAQTQAKFDQWLAANATAAVPQNGEQALAGERLFRQKTCANCHRVKGTTANGNVGPDLTHIAGRSEMLTGILPVNENNLFKWISHPQEIKPGAHMPELILAADSIKAIAKYLAQLK